MQFIGDGFEKANEFQAYGTAWNAGMLCKRRRVGE